MSDPVLDFANMMEPRVGARGLDPDRLAGDLADRFRAAHEEVEAVRAAGEMGFVDLPYAAEAVQRVRDVAGSLAPSGVERSEGPPARAIENLVVLGIGGSGLGAITLRDALLGPRWNELSAAARGGAPRLYVLDNADPATVADLLERMDLRRTAFNVVSKSGATAETMAQYLVVRGRLEAHADIEDAGDHFVFTTDPEGGALRRIAEAEGIRSLPVPPNVGGRFSVLSPVGLLPAAVCGVDVEALLRGAARMEERCRTPELGRNPAGLLATLLHAADTETDAHIHVLMPYADRLRSFARWFQQLWGESLGKERQVGGARESVGPTPVAAVGATDQHSQVQLFMEGPADKVVLFVAVGRVDDPVEIPRLHTAVEELGYLGGHTLAELLDAERRATAEALRRAGRLNLTLRIEELDAAALGGLFMLFQVATVYAGALYGVDPLVQPGVELGKRLTYGLLGRPGVEAPDLDDSGRNADSAWRV